MSMHANPERDTAMPRGRRERGVTLIELLIAIMITSLAFTGIFAAIQTGINVQVFVREMGDAEMVGPTILAQVSEDLRNTYFYNIVDNAFFEGHPVDIGTNRRADQFHFITTRPSLLADPLITKDSDDASEYHSPLTEVSYICREGEGGFYELYRREQNMVDEDPFRGGYYRLISDRIDSFRVQYSGWNFGGEEGEGANDPENPNAPANASASANANANNEGENARNPATNRDDPFGANEAEEEGTLVWEDEWVSSEKGGPPVAVKIELVVSPDVDPDVLRRMQREGRVEKLDKSYVHIVLLPNFREDYNVMEQTFAWDGNVAEPAATGGVAGGAAGGGRGGARGGGRGDARGDGRTGRGTRGGANNTRGAGANPLQQLTGGRSGNTGGSNPFLNLLQNR